MGIRLRFWQLAQDHKLAVWACLSAVLFMTEIMIANVRHLPGSRDPVVYAIAGVVYLALVVLYRFPAVTVLVSAAGSVALIAMGSHYPITIPAFLGSLFAFALANDKRRTLAVAVPVKLGLLIAAIAAGAGIASLVVVLWAALATSLGNAVRNHRGYLAEVTERARRAEQDAEDQARRRVAEERMRIARELHDVIGHHVALISVQAGAMSCLLEEDQAEARQSLAHIQRASANALEDLRLTVGLLREPGDREQAEPLQVDPVPGLSHLDALVGSFAGTGLTVTREVTGRPRPLPEAADLAAYRVIQESLTNIRKHAPCRTARLRLGYETEALRLAIENDGPPGTSQTAPDGHGIIGMRERVAAVGGRLSAGPRAEGGFRVLAELPLTRNERAAERMAAPAEVS
jgi:signal transduction histidine kinase